MASNRGFTVADWELIAEALTYYAHDRAELAVDIAEDEPETAGEAGEKSKALYALLERFNP